ncbi:MAG: EAL domain-containing protein [Desulfuromusa sp.]|jgi:diguanylate cyclase (GGDEF)-like protein/PAS domain S-box-containing protein|nr:EAL domain-containing protein [Desulfuromusa sp.]
MRWFSKYFVRASLPLILTSSIVFAGFLLLFLLQKNFHSYEQKVDAQIQNITAKKDLGELIVSDLRKVATTFYMILVSANFEQQELLFKDVQKTIKEIHDILDVLADGGTFSRNLFLTPPTQEASLVKITYALQQENNHDAAVLMLRSQLVDLEEHINQTINMTTLRNRLLSGTEGDLLQKAGLKLREFAKHIHSQLDQLAENANKLTFDSNLELAAFKDDISAAKNHYHRIEVQWAFAIILGVFALIGIVYRQIFLSQKKLEMTVRQLQQSEVNLQDSHAEILALNRSLEEQVAVRTRELQLSERLWVDAFNAVTSPIFLHNKKGRIVKANRAYLDLAESSFDEVFGQFYWNVFPKNETALPGCIESLQNEDVDCRTTEQDVQVNDRIFRSQSFTIEDDNGAYLYSMHYMEDVTEREKYIEELKKYEKILSTNTDLIAFLDKDYIFLAANSVYAEYFGLMPEEIIGQHAENVIGRHRYQGYLTFEKILFVEKKPLHFKGWVDYPKMGRRHMDITFTPYFEENGLVSGFVSRSRDITEISAQEDHLRLSAKVFESTSEGIIITDKAGSAVAVNPAFSRITGYSEEDALGQSPQFFKSGRHTDNFYQQMLQELAESGQWRGEIWNKRKNGEIYPSFLMISSIKNDEEETLNYVGVFSDITALKKAEDQLKYQAHHHPLTGLPNRLLLHARLQHSIEYAKRERKHGAVMFLDLDNFKKINDSLGHDAGDIVLKEVALRLQMHSREVDTVSHLSGDEFVIVLQAIRSIEDAIERAQQILESLQQPFIVDQYELYVSGSIGMVEFDGNSTDIEGLLKNADAAMYKAKEQGKNRYQLYSSELTDAAIEKVLLESHLRRAIERNELVLHYQPQVSLTTGHVIAVEALVRWQHPDLGLVMPDKFIPLSEETGLITKMGEWILKTACEQLLVWREQGYGLRRIAVNLSGKQIQQKNLPEIVERILLETGCPSASLELEITEGFIMQHPERSIAVLQQIRALGVELSIDDFGTGHSSLNYLKRLPINRLKIDRSFVWDIGENPEGEAITKAVIAMGHSLNLQITAEGIETDEQKKFLQQYHCNEGQGFLFSRPMPANEVTILLSECFK